MLVVEARVDSPILQAALGYAPDISLSHEEQYRTDDGINYLFWAEGSDFEAFEEGLAADRTVTNVALLAETKTRRLYRVTFTEAGEEAATFPSWSELDISVLDTTGTHEGWELRMRMPDREALRAYRDVCEDHGHRFDLVSVYEETESPTASTGQLTKPQREALVVALEQGYFDIPREASMADVAAELDISSQAASERIRRGVASLIDESVPSRPD